MWSCKICDDGLKSGDKNRPQSETGPVYMGHVFHFEKKIKCICNVTTHCYHSVLLSFSFYKLSLINARVQIKLPSTSFAMVTVKDGKFF
jgi:hypothetical protein